MPTAKRLVLILALVLVFATGLLYRIWLLRFDACLDGDGILRYEPLARNLLAGNGFSHRWEPPYQLNRSDVPLYPLFLAGVYSLTGGWTKAAVVAQQLLELGILVMLWQIVRVLRFPKPVGMLTLGIAWVMPAFASWTRWISAEILHTFGLVAFCYLLLLACRAAPNWRGWLWAAAGIIGGLTLLVRVDVMYVFLPVAGLWGLVVAGRMGFSQRIALLGVYAGAVCLTLLPWCIRDYIQFDTCQLPGIGQFDYKEPYAQWVNTWLDDPELLRLYAWHRNDPAGPTDFPPDVLPDANERERAREALLLGRQTVTRETGYPAEVNAVFASLHKEGKEKRPWDHQLRISLKRTILCWVQLGSAHGRLSWPNSTVLQAALKGSWLAILGSALLGIAFAVARRNAGLLLLAGLIASRTALPLIDGWMADCRYLVQALPFVYLFAALGVWMPYSWWRTSRRRDTTEVAAERGQEVLPAVPNRR